MTKNTNGDYSFNVYVGPKVNTIQIIQYAIPKTWNLINDDNNKF